MVALKKGTNERTKERMKEKITMAIGWNEGILATHKA